MKTLAEMTAMHSVACAELFEARSDRQREHDLRVELAGEVERLKERLAAQVDANQKLIQQWIDCKAELADWQRMRNEAMAVAESNRARILALEVDNEIFRLANRMLTQRDGSHVARAKVLESQMAEAELITKNWAGISAERRMRVQLLEILLRRNPIDSPDWVRDRNALLALNQCQCQHDISKADSTLAWMGSTPDVSKNTYRWFCGACHWHFDLPSPQPPPVRA